MSRDLPSGHRDITFPDLGRLTVNDKDQICLDGKPIEVQRLTLTKAQARVGIVTSAAVVLQALFDIADTLCGWLT